MDTLDQLGLKHGTDNASSFHDYLRTLDEFLSPIRDLPVVSLELGVLAGAGLRTFAEYFQNPDARIIGVDPHTWDREPIPDPRVEAVIGSQTDPALMRHLFDKYGHLDLIFDDGSHFASAQQESFRIIWPLVKPGRFYVIADLHSYAAPELCDAKENVMQWLTRIATEMQGRGAQASGKVKETDRWADLDTITFRKGMAVLRKMIPP